MMKMIKKPYVIFMTVGVLFSVLYDIWQHVLGGEVSKATSLGIFIPYIPTMATCAVLYRVNKKWSIWLPAAVLAGIIFDVIVPPVPPILIGGFIPHPDILAFFVSTSGLVRIIVDKAMKEKTPRWAYILVAVSFVFLNLHGLSGLLSSH